MPLIVKALNPDNQAEVSQICELYKAAYDHRFTISRVEEKDFWAARSSVRFNTVLVLEEHRVIAAVSFRRDTENARHVQLYMPAIHPASIDKQSLIVTLITDLIQRISVRQGWEFVYAYKFLQMPEQAQFADSLVNGFDTALWPSSLPLNPAADSPCGLGPVTIAGKFLGSESNTYKFFSPAAHKNICELLYSNLGIRSEFISSANSQISSNSIPADKRAFERRIHQNAAFSISFIEPSLLGSFNTLQQKLARNPLANKEWFADYLAFNLEDSKTPQFAEACEDLGFRFTGVIPFLRNRHSLLYSKTSEQIQNIDNIGESVLINYLRSQGLVKSKNTAITKSSAPKSTGSAVVSTQASK
jgi:hypothetical protein